VAKGFDPDTSSDCGQRGFTSCDPDDLPTDIPSRALCDNIDGKSEVTGKMRSDNFGVGASASISSRLKAYSDVQFGNKAGSMDAEDSGMPDVGNYKNNGQ
jgi:hypothetical protein